MTAPLPDWQNGHKINTLARPYYVPPPEYGIDRWPFHNYEHAVFATGQMRGLAKMLKRAGVEIEEDLYPLAGRLHDGEIWWTDLSGDGKTTAEEHSADLMEDVGRSLGMPQSKCKTARDLILASTVGVPCKTDTERVFRQGDLMAGGILDSPVAFLNGTYRLYRESKIKKGEPVFSLSRQTSLINDLKLFGEASYGIISELVAPDIEIESLDYEKLDYLPFAVRAARNLRLLTPKPLAEFLSSHLGEVVNYRGVSP